MPDVAVDGASLVVHTAALTSAVGCERDPVGARYANVDVTVQVAAQADAAAIPVVYPSTDWVFDGFKGMYRESDTTKPINEYGRTKADGEVPVLARGGLVLRGSFVGARPDGRSGLRELLGAPAPPAVARSRAHNPLDVRTYAEVLFDLAVLRVEGVVHVGCRDRIAWNDLCRSVRHDLTGLSEIAPAPTDTVRRPRDSSLDTELVVSLLGRSLPDSQTVVAALAANGPLTVELPSAPAAT